MKPSRIHAVDHIHIEAPREAEEALVWFYTEVGGLDLVSVSECEGSGVRFRSARLELRIALIAEPVVERVACRVTMVVPSLDEAMQLLVDRSIEFQPISGLSYTDRRVGLADPAGNRVELKQHWPVATL